MHGIVLSSMPVGEYDRRITILTAESGRISAFAKGARRPTSAFSACAQGFTYGEFTLYEGRDSYNLMRIERPNYFPELRNNLDAMYYGMYMCELAGMLTEEGADESDQMKLLYVSLSALAKGVIPRRLIRCIFELRCLSQYGEAPLAEGYYYSSRRNGLTDDGSGPREPAQPPAGRALTEFRVGEATLYTVRFVLSRPIKELYSFTVSDDVLDELEHICADYMGRHLERVPKSAGLLEL